MCASASPRELERQSPAQDSATHAMVVAVPGAELADKEVVAAPRGRAVVAEVAGLVVKGT